MNKRDQRNLAGFQALYELPWRKALSDASWPNGKIPSEAQLLLESDYFSDYFLPLSDSLHTPFYHSASWL